MAPHNGQVGRTTKKFTPTSVDCKYLWQLITAENENTLMGKLCTFLQGGLWCARLDTFGDPLEGKLPEHNLGLLIKTLAPQQVPKAQELYRKAVWRSFASCWHMSNDVPSIYAWCAFGGQGNGIAIRTTPEDIADKVVKNLNVDEDTCCYLGKVSYIDHGFDEIEDGNIIEPAFCVQENYQRENEARLLIHTSSLPEKTATAKGPFGKLVEKGIRTGGGQGYDGGHADGKAVVPRFDKQHLAIYIGDGVNPATCTRIIDLCEKYDFPRGKIFRLALQLRSLQESERKFSCF